MGEADEGHRAGREHHQHPVRQEAVGDGAGAVTLFVNHVNSVCPDRPETAGTTAWRGISGQASPFKRSSCQPSVAADRRIQRQFTGRKLTGTSVLFRPLAVIWAGTGAPPQTHETGTTCASSTTAGR